MLTNLKWKLVRDYRPLRLAGKDVAGLAIVDSSMTPDGVKAAYFLRSGKDAVRLQLRERSKDHPSEAWREMERLLEKTLKVVPE